MNRQAVRPGKAWMAAALVFIALLVGGLLLQQRNSDPQPIAAPRGAVGARIVEAIPTPPPPLGRAELITAADAAADAYAAGKPAAPAQAALIGRRFALRLPFGCFGPADETSGAGLRWTYDAKAQTLRLSVTPVVFTDTAVLRAVIGGAAIEAAEGFWIERPWLRSETCPRAPSSLETATIPPERQPTLGLAELFEPGGSRLMRRDGEPYEAVVKAPAKDLNTAQGFSLVLEGRVAALPSGQPIGCWSGSTEQRPVCLVSVRFDRVALASPQTEQNYAEWRN